MQAKNTISIEKYIQNSSKSDLIFTSTYSIDQSNKKKIIQNGWKSIATYHT